MTLEEERGAARKLCGELNVSVVPYGNAWWLLGSGINQVVGEIAGLSLSGLDQMKRPFFAR